MKKAIRTRRTPEESRENILSAAKALLIEEGPQSLRLADVAKAAGVSNATVLHYYGTIENVHSNLMERMIEDLVDRIMTIEVTDDAKISRGFAFQALLETFENKGAARLAAWLELRDETHRLTSVRNAVSQVISKKIHPGDAPVQRVQDVILLSVVLALGVGLFGRSLEELMGRPTGRARELALELLKETGENLSQ
tara:strand:+ start:10595 stop:11182 length:588 start_codon:yes stop_codon:yes gene_type:complete